MKKDWAPALVCALALALALASAFAFDLRNALVLAKDLDTTRGLAKA